MTEITKRFPKLLLLASGLGLGLLVGVGMMIGALSAVQVTQDENPNQPSLPQGIPLEAGTSSVGENISMATGAIDEFVEGVFILDHLTGQLSCFVVNPRALGSGVLIGQFQANVAADLGLVKGKEPDYVMTVGNIEALRGSGISQPAQCVVYVADGNSGNVIGYSLAWNTTAARSSRVQGGPFLKVMAAKARPNIAQE